MANWLEAESVLALEAYINIRNENIGSIPDDHPEIIQLSYTLKSLPFHPEAIRANPSFRPPNGVRTRITSFARLERGDVKDIGKIHQVIWDKYSQNLEDLKLRAQEIKSQALSFYGIEEDFFDEEFFVEGRLTQKIHKFRERNQKAVKQKKESVLSEEGKLVCEVCNFDFHDFYGELGKGFAECHHVSPLSDIVTSSVETRIDDLAILCANCHRMIHRHRPWKTPSELKALIRR